MNDHTIRAEAILPGMDLILDPNPRYHFRVEKVELVNRIYYTHEPKLVHVKGKFPDGSGMFQTFERATLVKVQSEYQRNS